MKKENFVTLIMSVVGGLIFMIVRANICLKKLANTQLQRSGFNG